MPATARLALPYPTPSDPADGPGAFQALAQQLDPIVATDGHGTLAARPAAGVSGRYYTDDATGLTYRDNGTAWAPLQRTVGRGTVFPSAPADGDEFNYVVGAASGTLWRFRYNAAAVAAGKPPWEFIGGPPLIGSNSLPVTLTAPGSSSPAAAAMLTVPRAGDYMAQLWSPQLQIQQLPNPPGGGQSIIVALDIAANPSGTPIDSLSAYLSVNYFISNPWVQIVSLRSDPMYVTGLIAGHLLNCKARIQGSGSPINVTWQAGAISLLPVRVS